MLVDRCTTERSGASDSASTAGGTTLVATNTTSKYTLPRHAEGDQDGARHVAFRVFDLFGHVDHVFEADEGEEAQSGAARDVVPTDLAACYDRLANAGIGVVRQEERARDDYDQQSGELDHRGDDVGRGGLSHAAEVDHGEQQQDAHHGHRRW